MIVNMGRRHGGVSHRDDNLIQALGNAANCIKPWYAGLLMRIDFQRALGVLRSADRDG